MRRLQSSSLIGALVVAVGCASGQSASPDGGGNGGSDGGGGMDSGSGWADAPPGTEICNGADDDEDQFVDEGTAEELCGPVTGGVPRCNGLGGCSIDSCQPGFLDLDNLFNTGCECAQEPSENGSQDCAAAVDLGQLVDGNQEIVINGNLAPVDDVDYFRFVAVDSPDSACDTFHVRAQFLTNPGDQFQLDVWRGGCTTPQLCTGITDLQWYTNFTAAGPIGQCPCTADAARVDGVPVCTDETAEFVVKVTRRAGVPLSCDSYVLELSNGKYPPP